MTAEQQPQQLNFGFVTPTLSESNKKDLLTAAGFTQPVTPDTRSDPDAYLITQIAPIGVVEARKLDEIREQRTLSSLGKQLAYILDPLNSE